MGGKMRNFDYKKLAEKNWDNEILLLCSKIHEYKGRQELFIRQKPAQLGRLIEIARIQSTEASNRIEGIVTTSTRIKQLVAEKTAPKNRDEKEILGYRDVLNTIHESHEYIDITAEGYEKYAAVTYYSSIGICLNMQAFHTEVLLKMYRITLRKQDRTERRL